MCLGFTATFWTLLGTVVVCLALIISGHVVEGMKDPTGPLPLWYQVDTCLNKTGVFTTSANSQLCASTTTSCPTTWYSYVARAPIAGEAVDTACPVELPEPTDFQITMEKDDGYRVGAPYSASFMLPSGATALVSFSIKDKDDKVLLPTTNAEFGPGETYPWREPATVTQAAIFPPSPAAPPPSALGCCQEDSLQCQYRNDGACDDGGLGSSYDLCPRYSDCFDCQTSGVCRRDRRKLERDVAEDEEQLLGPGLELSVAVGEAAVAAEAADAADDPMPAPGARRLLKGGYSSGGSYSSYSSSRSSYSGTSYSRSSGTSRSSYSGARSSYSTPSRSSYTSRTYSPSSYASRSSYGYYSYGGRGYYAGGRSYGYYYGRGYYPRYHSVLIVRPYGYGCYSCRRRSCYSCSSCNSRQSCGHESEYVADTAYDRYELTSSSKFNVPGDGKWPAYLVIHNTTLFSGSQDTTYPLYVTFETNDGEQYGPIASALLAIGYIFFFGTLILCCICASRQQLRKQLSTRPGDNEISFHPNNDPLELSPTTARLGGMNALPQQPYQQPTMMPPAAMPVATAYAGGTPMGAVPMATAYEGGAGPMAQAYPGGAAPMAQAYPGGAAAIAALADARSALAQAQAYPGCGAPMAQAYPGCGAPMAQAYPGYGAPMAQAYPGGGAMPTAYPSPPMSPPSPGTEPGDKKQE